MEILKTQDYNRFKPILGNRTINAKKVEKLKDDIVNGLNLLPYCPIIVYKSEGFYKIVDGQHRFTVCKELNHSVYYVECEKLDLKHIARMNSRSDKWRNRDFLECYVQLGNNDYERLLEFLEKYKVNYSVATELLMSGSCKNKQALDKFRDGEFEIKYWDESVEILDLSEELFGRYKFWNSGNLITALQEIKKAGLCDFEELKSKIKMAPNEMDQQSSWKSYIYNIERVYNFRNSKRVAIF